MKQIERNKLESMYNKLPNKEVCKKLGISNPTLVRLLEDAGIPLKGNSRKSKKIIVVD